MGAFWNTLWPILVAVLLFAVMIFIHEFGHFIFAKMFKIRVNEFALGFGPTLFKFTKGETKYALRLLPIGGFCAMEGENESSDDPRAFCNAKVYKRMIVVAAGAVFNIILGFLFMLFVVGSQSTVATTTVAQFDDSATSNAEGGLQVDDKILKINGRTLYYADDLLYMLGHDNDGEVSMVVERNGKKVTLYSVKFPVVEEEGQKFMTMDFKVYGKDNNILTTIKDGFWGTISMGRLVWMSLVDLITGRYGLNEMSGVVGVTQAVSGAVNEVASNGLDGLIYLMKMLCLITVNLGVFNLLPVPALDGSRLWFLAIEGVRGKPVKHEGIVHAVGMALLMLLMVVLIFKDLWVWIG